MDIQAERQQRPSVSTLHVPSPGFRAGCESLQSLRY